MKSIRYESQCTKLFSFKSRFDRLIDFADQLSGCSISASQTLQETHIQQIKMAPSLLDLELPPPNASSSTPLFSSYDDFQLAVQLLKLSSMASR